MMLTRLSLALALLLGFVSPAAAQYPSPTYQNLTVLGNSTLGNGPLTAGTGSQNKITITPGAVASAAIAITHSGTGGISIDDQLTIGSPTGGFQGAGTINAQGIFVNGVAVGTGSGSVTSVSGSGGTTGLTLGGGPITTSGTLTLGGTLITANGGTGHTNGQIDVLDQALTQTIANASVTGTTTNKLAKYGTTGVVITGTGDTNVAIAGICLSGCGTTGSATIAMTGSAMCVFDNATTLGDYVVASTTVAGDCHDAGSTVPTTVNLIGLVQSTNGSPGTYSVDLGTFGAQVAINAKTNPGGSNGQIQYNSSNTFAGFTASGDATIVTSTGVVTVGKVNSVTYPAGPSANTVPVVTSATSGGTVTYEALPLTAVATQSANTVVANVTAGSAAPTAASLPSCADTGGNHLNYTNGSGFSCGTSGGSAFPITAAGSTQSVGQMTVTGTNAGMAVVPNGNGAFMLAIPDGTATGGNARGNNAIDLQSTRTNASHVASGSFSFAAGSDNTVSNNGAMAVGQQHTVSGVESAAIGNNHTVTGGTAFAAGNQNTVGGGSAVAIGTFNTANGTVSAVFGDRASDRGNLAAFVYGPVQTSGHATREDYTFWTTTGGATAVRLTADGNTASSTNIANLPNNSAAVMTIDVIATDHTTGAALAFHGENCIIQRQANAASTTLGTGCTLSAGATTTSPPTLGANPTVTADTTNGGLNISVTPPAANTDAWYFAASIRYTMMQ